MEGAACVLGCERLGFGECSREADQTAAQGNGESFGPGGEHHAASAANQQRVAEELAEATERVAHRGLSHACALGGLRDAPLAREGVESGQEVQVDAVELLCGMSAAHASMETTHWIHVNKGLRVRAATRRHSWKKHRKYW